LVEKPIGENPLRDQSFGARIILKKTLREVRYESIRLSSTEEDRRLSFGRKTDKGDSA
jgi:hypothetical protein